jgi:hypothetical protein
MDKMADLGRRIGRLKGVLRLKMAFPEEESGCRRRHILRGPIFSKIQYKKQICLKFVGDLPIKRVFLSKNKSVMTTLTLKLETNDSVAAAYRSAKPSEKSRMKAYLHVLLEQFIVRERARVEMYSALDKLHDEAENNGLTDDIIEELLADES